MTINVKPSFTCNNCAYCCKHFDDIRPYLNPADSYTGIAVLVTRVSDGKELPSIPVKPGTQECIYLDKKNRCMIYNERPDACRAYPIRVHPLRIRCDPACFKGIKI